MTRYVALLRGIGPGNPNMRNEKLRGVCEHLGLDNVQTVISSGNIVFDSDRSPTEIETMLEAAWPSRLGFDATTILRSQRELEELAASDPFEGSEHTRETYLLTTFAKRELSYDFSFPHQPEGKDYRMVGGTERELFSVTDTVNGTSLDVMSWLEDTFGKEISSRTWLTVSRILKRMGSR
ncbi:MAG: DUF1697 domain-containing protein [Acidimicrobiia bacterium]|jgi:uncharacterized protein (DUF1697 family)